METDIAEVAKHIERCERYAADEHALYAVSRLGKHLHAAQHWLQLMAQAVVWRGQLGA